MLLSPALWIVAALYMATTCACDTGGHRHLAASRWKSKHPNNYTSSFQHHGDSRNYLGRKYGSARRQYYVPSTVSPWPYVVKKSFGPFTTTTTTTTPPSVHRMNLRLLSDDVKLRHRSRFPHLDSVMDRLDKYAVGTQRPRAVKNDLKRLDDENEGDVFDDDDGLVDDDYLLDAEDNNLDEDNDYLEDDTADDVEDIDDEDDVDGANINGKSSSYESSSWSGARQQHKTHERSGANVNAVSGTNSPFTAYKWEMYGTKQRADEARRVHLQQQKSAQTSQSSMNTAVFQHIMRMNTESRCKRPLPRVVNVLREHPAPGLTYIPHCTVLHRCSEDTGCCPNHNTRCAPKTQTQVHLFFYTSSAARTGNRVVKLPFYNHTECACLPRDSTNPITTEEGTSMIDTKSRSSELTAASIKLCTCPEEFVPSVLRQPEDRCICDCEDTNSDCLRMKKGKEYFSLKDRLCINTSKCGSPVCEYGSYLRDTGRCPKLQEKFDAFARVNVNRN